MGVASKNSVNVTWDFRYSKDDADMPPTIQRNPGYRKPKKLQVKALAGGCLKFWPSNVTFYSEFVSHPTATINISYSQHCQRLIFEDPPDTIEGVCMATTIEGSQSKLFKIKLLSQITTNILLSNKSFRNKVFGDLIGNDTVDAEDYHMVEFNVERIRQLRQANEEKERKRVR